MLKVIASRVLRIPPIVVFAFFGIVAIGLGSQLSKLKFSYNIETYFASNDSEVQLYEHHKDLFGNENAYVLVGVQSPNGVFQQRFLSDMDSLTAALASVNGVVEVFSPTTLVEFVKGPLGSFKVPLLHPEDASRYQADCKRVFEADGYVRAFFSPDTQSVSILIRKDGQLSRASNDSLLNAINTHLAAFNFRSTHVAGRIRTQHYYVGTMQRQMALFAGLACVLFLLALFIIFRDIRYVLIPLVAVLVSLVLIFGAIAMLEIPLDLMLTLLPSLVFIISTSGSIHLLARYRDLCVEGNEKESAIQLAVETTGLPNFLNAVTTAVGFASLVVIPVAPIQRFGIIVAVGLTVSFFVGVFVIPAVLRILKSQPQKIYFKGGAVASRLYKIIRNGKVRVVAVFVLVLGVSIALSTQININNHFLDDLNPNSPLAADLAFFEDHFSGIRPFELNVTASAGQQLLSLEALREMDRVEQYLKTNYGVGFVVSPLLVVKRTNMALNGGHKEYCALPQNQAQLDVVLSAIAKGNIWDRYANVVDSTGTIGRISGRTRDEGAAVFRDRNGKLRSYLAENSAMLTYRITGAAHLMDNANSHLAKHLSSGILLAILVATIGIALFCGSWYLAMLSLIPNLTPLILVAGFMGLVGIPLKVSTALLFTIAYGIAVDDTIHFINAFRLQQAMGLSTMPAIRETTRVMWRPMLFTSVVLATGFMIFALSEFASIALLGFLVSGALAAALIADLLLLPALIALGHKDHQSHGDVKKEEVVEG